MCITIFGKAHNEKVVEKSKVSPLSLSNIQLFLFMASHTSAAAPTLFHSTVFIFYNFTPNTVVVLIPQNALALFKSDHSVDDDDDDGERKITIILRCKF